MIVRKYIVQQICIKNIISKLNELDKLKHVVLDEKQLAIFDNIDNPPFHALEKFKQDNINSIWSDIVKMKGGDYKEFSGTYCEFKNKEEKSEIDKNMVNLIECMMASSI